MPRVPLVLLVLGVLSGCAALEQDSVQTKENQLAAAGFIVLPATTPARQAMLSGLPPDRVSQRIEGEHVSYLYPDPLVCRCVYVGGQGAWGRYQAQQQARQVAANQLEAAQLSQESWDWGPWGGYGPAFY